MILRKTAYLSLLLGKRPSEILGLCEPGLWLLEFDYQLLFAERERLRSGQDETRDEKAERIRRWAASLK